MLADCRPPSRPQAPAKSALPQCRALYTYRAAQPDELDLAPGDIITITNQGAQLLRVPTTWSGSAIC